MDRRVVKLIEAIDSCGGSVGRNLGRACEELNLYISPAYAARLFRRHTGMSIREYANKQRSLAAARRLAASKLPVKVIAAELGYRDTAHFTRFFKKQHLVPPAKFRGTDS
jgi:two-component system, response regulator YesN